MTLQMKKTGRKPASALFPQSTGRFCGAHIASGLILILLAAAVLVSGACAAEDLTKMTSRNWMSYLPDEASIGDINIPGTNDSALFNMADAESVQAYDLNEQFDRGIRWYEFRYNNAYSNKKYAVNLGKARTYCDFGIVKDDLFTRYAYQKGKSTSLFRNHNKNRYLFFRNGISDLLNKIKNNPSEFVVVRYEVLQKTGKKKAKQQIYDSITKICREDPQHFMLLAAGSKLPTVGEARGHIIFILEGSLPAYVGDPYIYDDSFIPREGMKTKFNQLNNVWKNTPAQDYSKTYYLNKKDSSCIYPRPMIMSTSFRTTYYDHAYHMTEYLLVKMNYQKGKYYGAVLYNYDIALETKKLYTSNIFTQYIDTPKETHYTYSGTDYTFPIPAGADYVSGTKKAANPGTYKITLKPKTGYQWKDSKNSIAKTITWTIDELKILKPELNKTVFADNSQLQAPSLIDKDTHKTPEGTKFYNVNITRQSKPGDYTVSVELNKNYLAGIKWSDKTTADLTLPWTIEQTVKSTTIIPELESYKYTYNGTPKTVVLKNDTVFEITANGTATDAGVYFVTISLKQGYTWEDGSKDPAILPWVIEPRQVTIPKLTQDTFTYTGSEIIPALNYTSDDFTIVSGGSATAVNDTDYEMIVRLTDQKNSTWSDGTTSDLSLYWTIDEMEIPIPELNKTSFVYDGTPKTVQLSKTSPHYNLTGNVTEINACDYYTVNVTLTNSTNFTWSDGSADPISLAWAIEPVPVTFPTLPQTSYQWTGTPVTLDIVPSSYYTASNTIANTPGRYSTVFTLNDADNTEWVNIPEEADGLLKLNDENEYELKWLVHEKESEITYRSMNESMGTVTRQSETIPWGAESYLGSTAIPETGYVFLYWKSAGNEDFISLDPEIELDEEFGSYAANTYTAVFGTSKLTVESVDGYVVFDEDEDNEEFDKADGVIVLDSASRDILDGINLIQMDNINGSATIDRHNAIGKDIPVQHQGYSVRTIGTIGITAAINKIDNECPTSSLILSLTFDTKETADANADKVKFHLYNSQTNSWNSEPLYSDYNFDGLDEDNETVIYRIVLDTYGPIAITLETPLPEPKPTQIHASSGGSGDTGAGNYNYYPRQADGKAGTIDFGTSKTVKSVTLPEGVKGEVTLVAKSTVPAPAGYNTHSVFEINIPNYPEGQQAVIEFSIDLNTLAKEGKTPADVGLLHGDTTSWDASTLPTTYSVEGKKAVYHATTTSFSPFAIVYSEGAAVPENEESAASVVPEYDPTLDETKQTPAPAQTAETKQTLAPSAAQAKAAASPLMLPGLLAGLAAALVFSRRE
ncbi:MAG TPA: PGF-pre-PGF domain-containing protein [Methanocorpusculum sp.]|nr:PGF-pre-PGF domain-containing protein [Methanocorpusculum sp.]